MNDQCIECKGNMLKAVVTRIDFDDLYEIEPNKLRELKRIAIENGLTMNMVRELNPKEDFELNDPMVLRELPLEYIRSSMCNAYFDEELNRVVEINQFFIRVIYKVRNNNYSEYLKDVLPLIMKFTKPLISSDLIIRRMSIKKVDEASFKDINEIDTIFKPEIVQRNIFSDKVRWDMPSSGSIVVQNFEYEKMKVNFFRKIDRILIRKMNDYKIQNDVYYRIYLEYEVYDRKTRNNIEKEDLKELLKKINEITRKLFRDSFTEDGWRVISEGGEIGSYVSN